MKAHVVIALAAMSVISLGSAAVLLYDAKPAPAGSKRSAGAEQPAFRWGEGSEASITPTHALEDR